ncbi:hypothetical protein H0H81_001130 [Sphagnurus paluster]|uniref:PNPLA domain-containing protein n=1 Tax=Sphagnurus paluster TaxID=117069 RepID=A0A9P7KIQ8_9AGAR|nr:hypothetical protein H0H81_001130 [Sphagnurus paluster]
MADNSGVFGLSQLEEIMNGIKSSATLPSVPRPCDYFDLIGGVGTGGIIALMLGRLQMPVEQAIKEYIGLSQRVFSQNKIGRTNHMFMFDASLLEDAIKDIIMSAGLPPDMLMCEADGPRCYTFVRAISGLDMSTSRLLRSYNVEQNVGFNCTVVEASRATTAAPEFFEPLYMSDSGLPEKLLGISLAWNDPVELVLKESEKVFGLSQEVVCVVSLGAGHSGAVQSGFYGLWKPDSSATLLQRIFSGFGSTAQRMQEQFRCVDQVYFRLGVEQSHQKTSVLDWQKLPEIKTHTLQYLSSSNSRKMLDTVATVLLNCPKSVSLANLKAAGQFDFHNIPTPTSVFTGQEDILASLEQCFIPTQDLSRQKRAVLYGLSGAGKTQIALKFLHDFGSRFSDIYWIDCSTWDGITFAAKANFKKEADDLSSQKKEWIMIFDNADDLKLNLEEFFPKCAHGNILITSQSSHCKIYAPTTSFKIDEMKPEDAVQMLLKTIGISEGDYELALDLVKDSDHQGYSVPSGIGQGLREYELSNDEWDLAAQLCNALKVFKDATLFFSREGTPNLATVIPAMDHIDEVLATNALDNAKFSRPLQAALAMGKNTLNRYYSKTDDSDIYRVVMSTLFYHLLLAHILTKTIQSSTHATNSATFKELSGRMSGSTTPRKSFAESLTTVIKVDSGLRSLRLQPQPHVMSTSGNRFDNLPSMLGPCQGDTRDELDRYLSTEPVYVADALAWWIERRDDYPCLSRMAIDFLTIPGTLLVL